MEEEEEEEEAGQEAAVEDEASGKDGHLATTFGPTGVRTRRRRRVIRRRGVISEAVVEGTPAVIAAPVVRAVVHQVATQQRRSWRRGIMRTRADPR